MKKSHYLILTVLLLLTILLCVLVGSVQVPLADFWQSFQNLLGGGELDSQYDQIIYRIRLPRVLTTAVVGAMFSLSGAIMQGLLKNPLADGSTLGISSGASLGAALAIVSGFQIDFLPFSGTALLSSLFAFLSLIIILSLAYRLDRQLSNTTVVLMGIIYSMLTSSLLSLMMVFFNEKVNNIIFWTMGSLAASSYESFFFILVVFLIFGGISLTQMRELNAFSTGEAQARNLGVDVAKVRLLLFVCISFLIGNAVAVAGNIAFVGLIIPHMARGLVGPNFQKLLPVTIYLGSIFLLLADLVARTAFQPVELPIGIITSIIGTLFFVFIYMRNRRIRYV